MQSADKLVLMANQIVRNLAIQGDDKAVALAADHMRKFWEPRMRSAIQQHIRSGGQGLSPQAIRAVEHLAQIEKVASEQDSSNHRPFLKRANRRLISEEDGQQSLCSGSVRF